MLHKYREDDKTINSIKERNVCSMNLKNKKLISVIICIFTMSFICFAAGYSALSPALSHIEKQISMKKCSVEGETVTFCAEDFDKVLCSRVEFVKIEELPVSEVGTLMMGSLKLGKNQILDRDDLDKLVFCPEPGISDDTAFVFSNATAGEPEISVSCNVYMLEAENKSPVAENMNLSTYEDVPVIKFLGTEDPEDDDMTFYVMSYPKHGTLRITEGSDGHFSYTPTKGYVGEDSFEYVALDSYGNRSRTARVSVNVTEKDTDIYFDDLEGHWAHNSAIKTASMGLMTGSVSEDGRFLFNPADTVTRGDFLAMALISAGKEKEISFVTQTSFDDDASIPMNIKSYAEYAKRCGIVTGYTAENGKVFFDSNSPVTRAEAALILSRILGVDSKESEVRVFADSASVPDWATDAMSNLAGCGILNGTGMGEIQPESLVTRAETAEIICNVTDYISK